MRFAINFIFAVDMSIDVFVVGGCGNGGDSHENQNASHRYYSIYEEVHKIYIETQTEMENNT